jgi:hypothetical protein
VRKKRKREREREKEKEREKREEREVDRYCEGFWQVTTSRHTTTMRYPSIWRRETMTLQTGVRDTLIHQDPIGSGWDLDAHGTTQCHDPTGDSSNQKRMWMVGAAADHKA